KRARKFKELFRELPKRARRHITRVGAEKDWATATNTSHKNPVPFDEPVLGIIGMWRLGGGANPHFALALGEVMMRVGQRYIAWSAYERTVRLADRFRGDPDTRQRPVANCRAREAVSEKGLPEVERDRLGRRLTAEL